MNEKGGLVLTRYPGEVVTVEHGLLEIQIIAVNGKQVRLRFVGNVKVDRKERLEEELELELDQSL